MRVKCIIALAIAIVLLPGLTGIAFAADVFLPDNCTINDQGFMVCPGIPSGVSDIPLPDNCTIENGFIICPFPPPGVAGIPTAAQLTTAAAQATAEAIGIPLETAAPTELIPPCSCEKTSIIPSRQVNPDLALATAFPVWVTV